MGEYEFDSVQECKDAGAHGRSVDEDGYCNACGHQDYDPDEFEAAT